MSRLAPARQQGFILITVLVALVLIAVVAERLGTRVDEYRRAQGQWREWAQVQSEIAAARDELLFAMLGRQMTQAGFGRGKSLIRVDGRPYRLPSGILVSVQDARGLIPLASADERVLRQFLMKQGVTDRDVPALLDALADYSDTDDRHRLNGAEKDRYPRLGLPPPRDDWPVSAWELSRVAGWHALPRIWQRAGDFFTPNRDEWINPNTAPPEVLAALPGAKPAGIAKLLKHREKKLVSSAAELQALSGILVDDEPVAFFPGRFYRIRLWSERGMAALECNLLLTPAAPRLPWLMIETRWIDRPDVPDPSGITPFPLAVHGAS